MQPAATFGCIEFSRLETRGFLHPIARATGSRTVDTVMPSNELHADLHGWWRIVETSQWVNDGLDGLGPALISITGYGDRLRMDSLLAYVNTKPTKTGASFTWEGAWEYDPMSGTGSVRIGKDGKLHGRIKIKDGDALVS